MDAVMTLTVRMWLQIAGLVLAGFLIGYALSAWQNAKDRRKHQLQVDHLRTRLRQRM